MVFLVNTARVILPSGYQISGSPHTQNHCHLFQLTSCIHKVSDMELQKNYKKNMLIYINLNSSAGCELTDNKYTHPM